MNLDTRGFADGFLNGFKTMADYQAQQKADKRADESLQMQKDENANAEKWRKTDYDHTLNREGVEDTRYTDETNYTRKRNKEKDDLEAEQVHANISNDKARTGAYVAQANSSVQTEKLRQQNLKFEQEQAIQKKWLEDNDLLLKTGVSNLVNGRPLSEQQHAVLMDERSGNLYLPKYQDQEYVSAAKGLKQSVQSIMSDFKPEQFGTKEFFNSLNTPEIKQKMGTVFKDEINKNVNYIDPSNGKLVVRKEYGQLVPVYTNGKAGLALDVIPVYEDGTKGGLQPITEKRSNDKNDKVQVWSPGDFVGVINARGTVAASVEDPAVLKKHLESKGIIPSPDYKGYADKATEIDKNTQSSMAQALKATAGNLGGDNSEVIKIIDEIKAQGEAAKRQLAAGYGLGDVTNGKTGSDDPSKQNQLAVSQWAGGDPSKQAFIKLSSEKGAIDLNKDTPEFLDKVYQAYQTELKNQSLEKAARESAMKRTN